MAIIDNTNNNVPELPPENPVQQPQVTQQQVVQHAQAQQQAQATRTMGGQRYWQTTDPSQTGPFTNRKGSINLNDLKARVESVYAAKVPEDPNLAFFTVPMDNTTESIYYSGLLFCMQAKQGNHATPVIVYAVLLENSNIAPSPANFNYNGINYEVPVTSDTALDDVFAERVKEFLSRKIKGENIKFIGGCMLPTNFDSDNTDLLDDLIFNSIAAVYTDLRSLLSDGATDGGW